MLGSDCVLVHGKIAVIESDHYVCIREARPFASARNSDSPDESVHTECVVDELSMRWVPTVSYTEVVDFSPTSGPAKFASAKVDVSFGTPW